MRPRPTLLAQLTSVPLERPCEVPWDEMVGDDRVRHCAQCARDVLDLSAMSALEAEIRLLNAGTHQPCIRYAIDRTGAVLHTEPPRAHTPPSRSIAAAAALGVTLGAAVVGAEEPASPKPAAEQSAPEQCVAYVTQEQADGATATMLADARAAQASGNAGSAGIGSGSGGIGHGSGAGAGAAGAGPSSGRAGGGSLGASGGIGKGGIGTSGHMYLGGGARAPQREVLFGTLRLKSKVPRQVTIVGIRLRAPLGSYALSPGNFVAEVEEPGERRIRRKVKFTITAEKTTLLDLDKKS
jgi:hypothetical protein